MKQIAKQLAGALGYEVRRATNSPSDAFHSYAYLRHNARRLEHLASLRIPVAGLTVLEVGAGIGDHTGYYLDRGCSVTITEGRTENLRVLSQRYPAQKIAHLDLDQPQPVAGAPFDVLHCYGLLYHLQHPEQALAFMAQHCSRLLFLETCVSFGADKQIHLQAENAADPTQAVSGTGCRPTRPWLFDQLQRHFAYVYCPRTQPNHDEFPLDWTAPEKHKSQYGLQRAVLIASRAPIENDQLSPRLLDLQSSQA